jgi:lauroyl/myristoyl acyltransferase
LKNIVRKNAVAFFELNYHASGTITGSEKYFPSGIANGDGAITLVAHSGAFKAIFRLAVLRHPPQLARQLRNRGTFGTIKCIG